jgi:hypothetical protein
MLEFAICGIMFIGFTWANRVQPVDVQRVPVKQAARLAANERPSPATWRSPAGLKKSE